MTLSPPAVNTPRRGSGRSYHLRRNRNTVQKKYYLACRSRKSSARVLKLEHPLFTRYHHVRVLHAK